MNKFTKLSAVSLLALLLTACDKPAEKAPEASQPQISSQQNTQNKQVTITVDQQNIAEFKALLNWDAQLVSLFAEPQEALNTAKESKDPNKINAALKQLGDKVAESLTNVDKLDIKNEQVKFIKEKFKENLVISLDFVNSTVGLLAQGKAPSEDDKKALNAKYQRLAANSQEVQQIREKLTQILAPKPAQPAQEQPAQK
ncbi:hypothetical protein [Lonepinella sp. BR2357]|uniref:hypothetical protein n=1 Tax=Lonepinella sp. BR2357 TaxID=3434549 RepID=UPI003F6DC1A5